MNHVVVCRACSAIVAFPEFPGLLRVSCPSCGSQVYPQSTGERARIGVITGLAPSPPPYHPLERCSLTAAENARARQLLATVEGL